MLQCTVIHTHAPTQTLKGQSGELNLECQDFDVFATLVKHTSGWFVKLG